MIQSKSDLKKYLIRDLLISIRFLFIRLGVDLSDEYLNKDLDRWACITKLSFQKKLKLLAELLWIYPEFRNLFIYRNRHRRLYRNWIKLFYKPMDTLFIQAKRIGGGLFIQHGFATMITAESIGDNCWINQQVTIGFSSGTRAPIIGDNVMITCGAKVLGEITVGNNVVIGANAVVINDVDSNCTVGGVPARVIK